MPKTAWRNRNTGLLVNAVEKNSRKIAIGCLCAVGCEVLYGLSYVFTKQATETASALSLLGWRFLVAFSAMSILVALGLVKVSFKGKGLKPLLLVALFSPVLYFIGETFGIGNTTASESGVFIACIPVASLVASTVVLGKKPTRLQVAGILVTLAGVLVTVLAVGAASSLSAVGYAFLAMAVVSYALYTVSVERAAAFTEIEITYAMLMAGAVVFPVLAICEAAAAGDVGALVMLPFGNPGFLTAILYLGLCCCVVAFFLANVAIAKLGVNRAVSFTGVATVASVLAGALFLGEQVTLYQGIGAVMIIVGVIIANMTAKRG